MEGVPAPVAACGRPPQPARTTTDDIWAFLQPVTDALREDAAFDRQWKPGGPWTIM